MSVFYDSIRKKYLVQNHIVIYDQNIQEARKNVVLFADRYFFAASYEEIECKIPNYISTYNKTMLKKHLQEIRDVKPSEIEELVEEYYNM